MWFSLNLKIGLGSCFKFNYKNEHKNFIQIFIRLIFIASQHTGVEKTNPIIKNVK